MLPNSEEECKNTVGTSTMRENIIKYQTGDTELNSTIPELKNTLEGFDSRVGESEEWKSELKDKAIELTPRQKTKTKKEF